MKLKSQKTFKLFLAFLLVLIHTLSFSQDKSNRKPSVISLNEALKQNLLDLKIFGASDDRLYYESVDKDGLHYGKCIQMFLKSKIDSIVLLKIDCGTELLPIDNSFQTMIVTKTVELPLYPNTQYPTRIYAMCGQLHDDPPYINSEYKVGELSDSITVKLARYFDQHYIQNMIGQHALWAYTDKANYEELKTYGADSLSIILTSQILDSLSIETVLNPQKNEIKAVDQKAVKVDDSITIKKYWLYVTGGVGLILIFSMVILIFKKTRKDKDYV